MAYEDNFSETTFGVSAAAKPAPTLKLVTSNGDLSLYVDENGKAWIGVGGSEPFAVTRGGVQVNIKSGNGYSLTDIGRDAQGVIRVLDSNPNMHESYGWKLDAHGAYKGEKVYGDANYDEAEGIFHRDFNGDGITLSGALKVVHENGGLTLYVDSGSGMAYFRDGDGPLVPISRDGGTTVHLTRGDWSTTSIGYDADGNVRLLDYNPKTDTCYAWKLGPDGKFIGQDEYNHSNIDPAEKIFQKDLNGDGHIPTVDPRTVDTNGKLALQVDTTNGVAYVQLENGDRITLSRDDRAGDVTLKWGSYTLIAVGRDEQGHLRVLDSGGPNQHYYSWILDDNGHMTGQEEFRPDQIKNIEHLFDRDLDGDGDIFGAPLTVVEDKGPASLLYKEYNGDAYIQVNGGEAMAITRGPGNVDITNGAWHLVAATVDEQGRARVLDFNPESDQAYAWILDSKGHFIGEQVFSRENFGQAEQLFDIDLNGDGVIGDHQAAHHTSDWAHAA